MEETQGIFDEIDASGVARDLWKNLWIILLGTISFIILGTVSMMFFYTPKYTMESIIAISSKNDTTSLNNLRTTSQMATIYQNIFEGDVLKEIVKKDLGEEKLGGTIKAELVPETNLMTLSVESSNAGESFQIIKSILNNYHKVSDSVFDNAVLDVIVNPKIPLEPSNALNLIKYAAVFGAVGLLIMISIIVVAYVMRDTIKNEKSISKKLDCKLVSIVGHEEKNKTFRAKRKKIRKSILLDNVTTSFGFIEAFHKLSTKLEYYMKKESAKIVMVTSVGENEGKSTVTANLALAWSEKGKKVLLLDGDFRRPAMFKVFDSTMEKEQSFTEYLLGNQKFSDVLLHNETYDIDTLFSMTGYANSSSFLYSDKMKAVLANMKEIYDYIIIDTAPLALLSDTEILADMVDVSLLVIRQDVVDARNLNDAIDLLKQSHSCFLGCILNDFRQFHLASSGYGYGYGAKGYYGKNYSYGAYGGKNQKQK